MPTRHPTLVAAVAIAASLLILAGCGGSTSTPSTSESIEALAPPNLHAFLKLPVASPSACASDVNGTTVGRASPWVGHVDLSVFLKLSTPTRTVLTFGRELKNNPLVSQVYFESRQQAYREFQRLYTCSASVKPSQTPESYRVVLYPTTTIAARDILVAKLTRRSYVDSVSCDPTIPCTDIVASPSAAP